MLLIKHDCAFMEGTLDLLSIKQYIFTNSFNRIELPSFRELSKINSAKSTTTKCALDVEALQSNTCVRL